MKPHDDKFTEIYNTVKEMYPNAQAVKIEISPGTIIVTIETMAYTLVEEHGNKKNLKKNQPK